MTGFGRFEKVEGTRHYTVEIKSVNHRYLDMSVKLPKKLNHFEVSIRNLLKKYILRGKVDVYISFVDEKESQVSVHYNKELAKAYYENLCQMSEDLGLENDIRISGLSRYPEVFTLEEQTEDEEELWSELEETVRGAAERFVESRITEGEHLKSDLTDKLNQMKTYVDYVEERSPQIVAEYRAKLTAKVEELLGDTKLDQSILATEITLYADKICVDEETVRLRSHLEQMNTMLTTGGAIGRKLDFLLQEMNRESNTIGSKCTDVKLARIVVDIKAELEKIREQTQNIE